jgi:acyl-CoA thioesterase FadM
VAEASTILVAYDYESEQPIRVPDAWRDAFATHEGRSLEKPA